MAALEWLTRPRIKWVGMGLDVLWTHQWSLAWRSAFSVAIWSIAWPEDFRGVAEYDDLLGFGESLTPEDSQVAADAGHVVFPDQPRLDLTEVGR